MASVFRSVRRRLDAMPLWGVLLIDAAVLGLWLIDFRIPDEIPVDKVLLGGVFLASGVYAWRRYFGPPGALSTAARRKVAEIELLFEECRKAAGTIPGASGEVARLADLLSKVHAIEQRLEQTETVLLSPQYDVVRAQQECDRLVREIEAVSDPRAKENFIGALAEAKKHAENIEAIVRTRDELSGAFERIYQLVRRIHSQIVGIGLAQGTGEDLASSVDELQRTLLEYEREQEAMARAEKIAEQEIAEAVKGQAAKRTDLH